MESIATATATATTVNSPLHSLKVMHKRMVLNRAFALIYIFAILALFYHHIAQIFHSKILVSFTTITRISMLICDMILAFMWKNSQSFHMHPITRKEFPEKLENFKDFPALDVFICTADPYKEPPINVANTGLSVLAYDYPTEKLSVYVSDDGGSELTMFAISEAAKFAVHWLPFCRDNRVFERCPHAYFRSSNYAANSQFHSIKLMYESMVTRINKVVERGRIGEEYISNEDERQAYTKFSSTGFTPHHHPSIIQVLLANGTDKDITDVFMPNFVYISRQKCNTSPHHFKAGALNVLLRVSGLVTNAPTILTLDSDMYSNDPSTPKRALCYFLDQSLWPKLAYIQTPQRFHGLNWADIYASEFKFLAQINPLGMDGLRGPNYLGTGCFFRRRALFGGPSTFVQQEMIPDHAVNKPIIKAQNILKQAHKVASYNYENQTNWGFKMGFRYGSLVEDFYTGYQLHCEGWKSVFCNPERPAFLGHVPLSLVDVLIQIKRWSMGLLEVAFSKYSPFTFGTRSLGPIMAQCYAYYAFWPIYFIPITLYAFLPQLSLLTGVPIFPKISNSWTFLYIFLFLGAYAQDCLNFVSTQGSLQRWWNYQRMWIIWGLSSFPIGTIEYLTKRFGIATQRFNITSKVVDHNQSTRYDQGIFEFGVASPMFVPLTTTSIINLMAFLKAIVSFSKGESLNGLFLHTLIACFGVINCLPIYEAMVLRADKGRMDIYITIISTFLALCLYTISSCLV